MFRVHVRTVKKCNLTKLQTTYVVKMSAEWPWAILTKIVENNENPFLPVETLIHPSTTLSNMTVPFKNNTYRYKRLKHGLKKSNFCIFYFFADWRKNEEKKNSFQCSSTLPLYSRDDADKTTAFSAATLRHDEQIKLQYLHRSEILKKFVLTSLKQ